ncbi:GGDEF domain-containing protein [Devosia sp.]|uniref:GGDEF domain-containing protein n=1 Tax=Devosia sp. TaxID=1871048 RepID=UPI0032678EB1
MTDANLMQAGNGPFWARIRGALGAKRPQGQPAQPVPAYGKAAIARSLGMKPRLGAPLEEHLLEAWQASAARHVSLSLLVIEIDRFTEYFSAYGRATAEDVAASLFETVGATLPRQGDTCFRLGRHQFVVALPDYPVLMARVAAQKIASAIYEDAIIHKESHAGVVTVSIGIAVSNPAGGLDRRFFEAANGALSKAQWRGLNRIEAVDLRKAKTRKDQPRKAA